MEALANHNPTRSSGFGTQHDIMHIDVLDRSCQEDEEEGWTNVASNEKWKIDTSFFKLFDLHKQFCGAETKPNIDIYV